LFDLSSLLHGKFYLVNSKRGILTSVSLLHYMIRTFFGRSQWPLRGLQHHNSFFSSSLSLLFMKGHLLTLWALAHTYYITGQKSTMPYNPITAIPRVTTAPLETTGIKLASGRRRRPVVKFERFDLDIFLFLTQCV
jgi:hypothetical protein